MRTSAGRATHQNCDVMAAMIVSALWRLPISFWTADECITVWAVAESHSNRCAPSSQWLTRPREAYLSQCAQDSDVGARTLNNRGRVTVSLPSVLFAGRILAALRPTVNCALGAITCGPVSTEKWRLLTNCRSSSALTMFSVLVYDL